MINFFSKPKVLLFLIFILALSLRLYGLNWDQSQHFHPDERMITMVAQEISIPKVTPDATLGEKLKLLFSVDSSLNPRFFAYGSLPIYLLRFIASIYPPFLQYDYINLLGRVISAVFDTLAILYIYKISYCLFKSSLKSLLSSLFYALTVFPIQLSHFYAVDTLLNFFILFTLYYALQLHQKFSFRNALLVGVGFGLALATKVSALVLIISLGTALLASVLLSLKKDLVSRPKNIFSKIKNWFFQKKTHFKQLIFYSFVIFFSTVLVFLIFEPFSIIDFPTFWRQINEQSAMTRNSLVFPYTLQYYGTLPFIYPLKNIFLWGLGPLISVFAFTGLVTSLISLVRSLFIPGNEESEGNLLIIYSFFIAYFLVVGSFAVKFMRYCLPLYPILVIFAANYLFNLKKFFRPLIIIIILFQSAISFGFIGIYGIPNTRYTASLWMIDNIRPGSTILREHWDDGLPVGQNSFNIHELALYDPDILPDKWPTINDQLKTADYLVVASNRLYTPLSKMTDCTILPEDRCYPITAKYYQALFSGSLGFVKVAEFTSYPKIFGFTVNDQSADESFTVYDHPKIMIFKKNQ